MNTNTAIESFISKCDDMMIAEESLIDTIKKGFIKFFTGVINILIKITQKLPSGNLKQKVLTSLTNAKDGLNKSKKINTATTEEDINDIKEIEDELSENIIDFKAEIERITQQNNENKKDPFNNINGKSILSTDEIKKISDNMADSIIELSKSDKEINNMINELLKEDFF